MAKTIFDHIKMITEVQEDDYIIKLSEEDKKTFDIFLLQKFLGLNNKLVDAVSYLDKYVYNMTKERYYKLLIYNIPKNRYWIKFPEKNKKEETSPEWFIKLIILYFGYITVDDAIYYDTLLSSEERRLLCKMFGIDKKKITQLN